MSVSNEALQQYGWAPGGYMIRCMDCGGDGSPEFADKRASRCRACAVKCWERDTAKPQAMTTAAPPEKMTNDELAAWLKRLSDLDYDMLPQHRRKLCEAARRLSAPDPAAPRVGDTVRHEEWCASLATTRLTKQSYECNCASAPPAASADERLTEAERLLRLCRNYVMATEGEQADKFEVEITAFLETRYRKRAAHDEIRHLKAEIIRINVEWRAIVAKWRADYDALALARAPLIDAARDAMRAFGNYIQYPQIRGENYCAEAMANAKRLELALSALPKGQEHE